MDQPEHNMLHRGFTFLAMQPVLLTPLIFVVLMIGAKRAVQRGWLGRSDGWNFAISFSLPLMAICFYSALKVDQIRYQWDAPVYLSLILAGAAVLAEGLGSGDPKIARRWRRFAWAGGIFSLVMIGSLLSFLSFGMPRVSAITARLGCWRELNDKVEAAEAKLAAKTGRSPFILSFDKYKTSAVLGFYSGEPGEQVNKLAVGAKGYGYSYWIDLESWRGRPAIAVIRDLRESDLDLLKQYFDRVGKPRPVQVNTINLREQTFYLVDCYDYRPTPSQASLQDRSRRL